MSKIEITIKVRSRWWLRYYLFIFKPVVAIFPSAGDPLAAFGAKYGCRYETYYLQFTN